MVVGGGGGQTRCIMGNVGVAYYRKTNVQSLSPCGHPAITDTPIIRTADKFRAKINYRHLTEINSRYYGLSLQRTLT